MEITEKEYPKLHKELWIWCSKNPGKKTYDWPEWGKEYLPDIEGCCFACEYTHNHGGFCPLLGRICSGCDCLDGLYRDWCLANKYKDYKKVSKLALIIANLPWQEEVK